MTTCQKNKSDNREKRSIEENFKRVIQQSRNTVSEIQKQVRVSPSGSILIQKPSSQKGAVKVTW